MCLLCPQQIAQQTTKTDDGFHAEAKFGTLTFDGFTRTVPYNSRNGLPILFTAGQFSTEIPHTNTSSLHTQCTNAYTAALLSTEIPRTEMSST
jgi:hypothetical protein